MNPNDIKPTHNRQVEKHTNLSIIFHRTPEPSNFPGPPYKPIISDVTETSVHLAWRSNPNSGSSKVFAYTVEYFSHETGEVGVGWSCLCVASYMRNYVSANVFIIDFRTFKKSNPLKSFVLELNSTLFKIPFKKFQFNFNNTFHPT